MKYTVITDENASAFKSVIGDAFKEHQVGRLFCGVVDDDDAAAGAAYFDEEGDNLWLGTIGVADELRRRGFGSFLLKESGTLAAEYGFRRLCASFYEDPEELKSNELAGFLTACDFKIRKAPVERQVFLLSDFYKQAGNLLGEKKEGLCIKNLQDLSGEEKIQLLNLFLGDEERIGYFREDVLFSKENKYGSVAFREGEPVAAAAVLPFEDGVRLDQLYGKMEHISELHGLLWDCLEKVKKASKIKHLYIDIAGEQLLKLQKQRFERAGILCERCLQGYIAEKELGAVSDNS